MHSTAHGFTYLHATCSSQMARNKTKVDVRGIGGCASSTMHQASRSVVATRPWSEGNCSVGKTIPSVHRATALIAVVGDAELDEGNIYEALLEGWKHNLEDVWWVIDYNRQSLDSVISDRLLSRFTRLFNSMG